MEYWKFIDSYKSRYGRYRVSNLGRVKNGHGTVLSHHMHKKGYVMIAMIKEGKEKRVQIHRIVANAFIPNPDQLPQVNHINGNKSDNRVSNLQWCTNAQNMAHANLNGLRPNYKEIFTGKSVKGKYNLSNKQIIDIRNTKIGNGISRVHIAAMHSIPLSIVKDIRGGRIYPYII